MTGRLGRIRKQLRDDVKENIGYCRLKEDAPDCTVWRTRFGRGCGPVVRHYALNEHIIHVFILQKVQRCCVRNAVRVLTFAQPCDLGFRSSCI